MPSPSGRSNCGSSFRLHDLRLRRGFEIGFLIILPFLIIDMIVATLVMSMGMMMMSPAAPPCRS